VFFIKAFDSKSRQILTKIKSFSKLAVRSDVIDPSLYKKYNVKRGLRDENGNGVVAGLTEISDIVSSETNKKGEKVSCKGRLYYRGISIEDLVDGFVQDKRFGFEETAYLLLFGVLPDKNDLNEFQRILSYYRTLPPTFVRDIIMKAPSDNMMNMLARSVISLYSYDNLADNTSINNILRQSLELISQFPLIAVYGYQAYNYYHTDGSLIIHRPKSEYSTAENILHLLRPDCKFTSLEARLLDLCLVLHAEHGGGNNSSFTTHVVSSSGTDTYSSVSASLGSLKGPKHGGANIKVVQMFDDMKNSLKDYSDDSIKDYLAKLLDKQAFDNLGLIYGMGHAVYSLSDPRAEILKDYAMQLAAEKNQMEEFKLYEQVERLAPIIIAEKRKIFKGVSSNVDFYSGLVYTMLGLPRELYTPIFAIARITGWSAHRIEEVSNNGKIIRPGYKNVGKKQKYKPLDER
jgi:citrate synthase